MGIRYFLRIENEEFGFVVNDIHNIKESDIEITEEEHKTFLDLQSKGKAYRLKSIPNGTSLFDYLEEYTREVIKDNTPTMEDRIKALELSFLEVL